MFFGLVDNIVVNPQIIAKPTVDKIRAEISFKDQYEEDWTIFEKSKELYRFKYSFSIHMTRAMLEVNIATLQTNLERLWVSKVPGNITNHCCNHYQKNHNNTRFMKLHFFSTL